MASVLTKDQLKNALISHGVELPSPSAKKEEYLRLYEKFVAPLEQSKGEFSSDDEDSPVLPVANETKMDQSLIVDGLDISTLSDDELFKRLQNFGATVGPIVASTRKVYRRKLAVLMGGDLPDSPPAYNGDVDEDEYSDSEEADAVPVQEPVRTRSSPRQDAAAKSPSPSQNADLRRRILANSDERPREEVVYNPDRHTPSPRPSLRSVTSTTTSTMSSETIRGRKYFNNGRSGLVNASSPETATEWEEQEKHSKISLVVRLIVKLLFLALIIAIIYYVYQNDPSESPFKAVEQLARQALEAAVGEEAEVKDGDMVDSVKTPKVSSAPEPVPAL